MSCQVAEWVRRGHMFVSRREFIKISCGGSEGAGLGLGFRVSGSVSWP